MEITEVRIKLTEDTDDRLQAFCSITFDDAFVVRDLKIIEGTNGPFVAMPSRKLTTHCQRCRSKNHIRANYCNQCGTKITSEHSSRDHEGRAKLYADIAHPINSACREMIQNRIVEEYQKERELSKTPGYVSRYEDNYDDVFIGSDFDDVTVDKPDRRKTTIEVQPGQTGLQAPHSSSTAKSQQSPATPSSGRSKKRKSFGAGILDE